MVILVVAIDLAKKVFAVHGVNEAGQLERVRPAVARAKRHALIASLPPCTNGMEDCSGAHHWARWFFALGRTVCRRPLRPSTSCPPWPSSSAAVFDRCW